MTKWSCDQTAGAAGDALSPVSGARRRKKRPPADSRSTGGEEAREKDVLFAVEGPLPGDFDFGPDTAVVFDDMLRRSVPFYTEIQRMIAEMTGDFAVPGTNVYDLGCSTCATFRALSEIDRDVTFVGIDESEAMLARAERELTQAGFPHRYELRRQDFHDPLAIENASVVILSLTLQFVRPLCRKRLLRSVYEGLRSQGCLILVEKVLPRSGMLSRLFINHYYDFKRRNGYSDIEIARKREALENVLIPYRLEENVELLRSVGFRDVEVFFCWYNFCGILGVKE